MREALHTNLSLLPWSVVVPPRVSIPSFPVTLLMGFVSFFVFGASQEDERLMKAMVLTEVKEIFAAHDLDGDGKLCFQGGSPPYFRLLSLFFSHSFSHILLSDDRFQALGGRQSVDIQPIGQYHRKSSLAQAWTEEPDPVQEYR